MIYLFFVQNFRSVLSFLMPRQDLRLRSYLATHALGRFTQLPAVFTFRREVLSILSINHKNPLRDFMLDAPSGFEPEITDSESVVMPFHYGATLLVF